MIVKKKLHKVCVKSPEITMLRSIAKSSFEEMKSILSVRKRVESPAASTQLILPVDSSARSLNPAPPPLHPRESCKSLRNSPRALSTLCLSCSLSPSPNYPLDSQSYILLCASTRPPSPPL